MRGRRVVGRVPLGHWKSVTFVEALRQGGLAAPFVIDRAMTGSIFPPYPHQCLAPTPIALKSHNMVVIYLFHYSI